MYVLYVLHVKEVDTVKKGGDGRSFFCGVEEAPLHFQRCLLVQNSEQLVANHERMHTSDYRYVDAE